MTQEHGPTYLIFSSRVTIAAGIGHMKRNGYASVRLRAWYNLHGICPWNTECQASNDGHSVVL
jgi:hypothetical protein